MLGRSFLCAAIIVAFATPALAFHCPLDVKAIDNALSKPTLSDHQKTEVKRLRDEGEAAHNAGNHKEAVDKLSEAMRIISHAL